MLAILALAACADGGTTTASPETGSSTGAATGATGTTGSAQATASGDQNPSWLNLAPCGQPQDGIVHYQIGGTAVALPQSIVRRIVLLNTPETQAIDQTRPLADQLEAGLGCENKPLPLGGVITQSPYETDLLEGNVSLFPIPTALIQNYQQLITQLQRDRPANACQDPQGDLLLCFGQETVGETTKDVLYLISTDANEKLNFQAPLFARCEIRDRKPVGCNLGDLANPQIFFDATLARLPNSTADLRTAHRAVFQKFGARSATPSG